MYFKGHALNDKDLILKAIPASERNSVIVDLKTVTSKLETQSLVGTFDIYLTKKQTARF